MHSFRTLSIVLTLIGLTGLAYAEDGTSIMSKVADRPSPKSTAVKMQMTLTQQRAGKTETEARALQVLSKETGDGARMVMKFAEPADIKGVGFLAIENKGGDDDMWLYMPALKRVTRISAAKKSENFMGTDFTYADLEAPDAKQADHKLLREEQAGGFDTWVIESTPKAGSSLNYAKIVNWIRKDNYIPVQAEFYDKGGKLLKKMFVEGLEQQGKYWIPKKTRMENVQSLHATLLEIVEQKTDVPIEDKYFTERYLQQ